MWTRCSAPSSRSCRDEREHEAMVEAELAKLNA
jgi:hypothetical protein